MALLPQASFQAWDKSLELQQCCSTVLDPILPKPCNEILCLSNQWLLVLTDTHTSRYTAYRCTDTGTIILYFWGWYWYQYLRVKNLIITHNLYKPTNHYDNNLKKMVIEVALIIIFILTMKEMTMFKVKMGHSCSIFFFSFFSFFCSSASFTGASEKRIRVRAWINLLFTASLPPNRPSW